MSYVTKVARESLSLRQQVTERLRESILDGRLSPGQKLVERELCSLLDISRTLLREALQQLQAEGLITTIMHKGPSVAIIGREEAAEIYAVREALEPVVARDFVRNATDAQIRELRTQFERIKAMGVDESLRDLLLAKNGFYAALFDGCGNHLINQLLTQLTNRMLLYGRLAMRVPGRVAEMIGEMEAIVIALEARDAERAAESCARHVSKAAAFVMEQLPADAGD